MSGSDLRTIAVLDVGMSTGIAIVAFGETSSEIVMLKKEIATIVPYQDVAPRVLKWKPEAILMEDRPMYASQEGLHPWMRVFNDLTDAGYKDAAFSFSLDRGKLSFVKSGMWKPVMKRQQVSFMGAWAPQTQHEKDALMMLHFWIKINKFPGKDMLYAQ